MNINNFRYHFSSQIASRGKTYYKESRIKAVTKSENGNYIAYVKGSYRKYEVDIKIEKNGNITSAKCTCPYDYGYCKHIYAVLIYLETIYDDQISDKSSNYLPKLIEEYSLNRKAEDEAPVSVEPELWLSGNDLFFRLKIGRERKYSVGDIKKLKDDFKYQSTRKYGKFFEWRHRYNDIDPESRRLIELAYDIYQDTKYNYYSNFHKEKEFRLRGKYLERFLEMYKNRSLMINDKEYRIENQNPSLRAVLTTTKSGKMKFAAQDFPLFLGSYDKGYFMLEREQIIACADNEFTRTVEPIANILNENNCIIISKNHIPAFYNTVLRQIEGCFDIDTTAVDDALVPPSLVSQLYIDIDDEGVICAALMFSYGDKIYPALHSSGNKSDSIDPYGEETALSMVCRYFDRFEKDNVHPFQIHTDDAAFALISEGMSVLGKYMELYVSDRFKKINMRPSVTASVGVKPSGGLLELNIEASGYSAEELLEILDAYRQGKKYHRFRDGSFSIVDDSIKDLDMFKKELNISDKEFLKEHITVPMYRMLYLNSLRADEEHIRLKRSSEFRRCAKDYDNMLRDEDAFTLSDRLDTTMRDYQKYGFRWMKTLGMYNMGGILADDMGLGKTIQAIAVMQSIKNTCQSGEHKQFLVICPSSLTLNWQNEIERFSSDLSSVCISGTVAERSKQFEEMENYDVVITSYATLLRDIAKYETKHFSVQFLDEAQNIKNHNTQSAKAVKAINSDQRFALTGTPVENTLAELWSIFDFIMPGYLHHYSYFKKNFETPIVKKNDTSSVRSLQRLTSPFVLRRLKSEVLTELPDKTETVLEIKFDEKQNKLYLANAAKVKGQLKELDESKDKLKILAMLTKLRQICCDPSLLYENYDGESAKLEQCMDLIKSCIESGHKILLFSQFTSMLDIIADRLMQDSISFYTLTGSTKTKDRMKMVNEFNENDVSVFLISLKAGGTGLNLTGADIVIHYDPWWNLSAENQASDRVYRIGQRNNVQIYKLIVKNTIEEKIRILQQKKADLLETAVGGEGDIINMTTEEIMDLL